MTTRWMSPLILAALLAAASGGPGRTAPTAGELCPAGEPRAAMRPTLTSDFTTAGSLSGGPWRPSSGVHQGGEAIEAQFYDPAQVALAGAAGLRLSVRPEARLGKAYASGQVTTLGEFGQRYGHFEMMARMPQANGLWPAFWMLPTANRWPPEIDVVEYIYAVNGVHPKASASDPQFWIASNPSASLYWGTLEQHQHTSPMVGSTIPQTLAYRDWNTKPAPAGWPAAYTGYHVYAVDWRPGSLVWTIDGASVFCVSDTPGTQARVPSTPMYLLISLEVASGTRQAPLWAGYVEDGTPWPQVMDIAYVHVFQFKDL